MCIGGEGLDIVCSSNDDNQADILYQACDTMRLMIDPDSLDTWRNQKWIRCKVNDNKIFKLSDKTRNKEGRNIDVAVIDEVHEMKDNVIVKSIEQSQSLKPNPKLILITTEGFINDGFLDHELIRARGILRGEIEDAASVRYLPWLYTQDSEQEVWQGNQDNRLWMKSNPSLGKIKRWDYLEQQIDLARQSTADRAFVLAKDFNIKQSNSAAWLMLEDYDYDKSFDLEEFRGALCLGGVDIAETTDLSCAKILLMKPNDSRKYIHTQYFIPEGKLERANDASAGAKYLEWAQKGLIKICPGNYLTPSVIADWFAELYKEYGIRLYKCGYDARFATDFLSRMEEYGFETVLVYQSPEVLNSPIKMVEADLKSRQIIGNNELDRWCFGNAALKVDTRGNGLVVKIDGLVSKKIDGAVTTVIVYEVFKRFRTEFIANL
jgi:phage terminase large subunit-like protein